MENSFLLNTLKESTNICLKQAQEDLKTLDPRKTEYAFKEGEINAFMVTLSHLHVAIALTK